jgi:mannosyltransferase
LTSQSRSSKHLVSITLVAILTAATLLRFYRLNSGLWFDEIVTYIKYAQLPFLTIVTTFDSENQHFLYSILAHLSLLIFGDSNWALRLPAVFFGVASIWALFLFGREIRNDTEALLASALLTFSYHHVWFSQNARGYSGLLFWSLLSSWLFTRGLRENKIKTWVFFGISAALGVYTHLTMVFMIIGQFVVYLIAFIIKQREYRPARWVGLWVGFGIAGLLTLILLSPVYNQILGTIGGSEVSVVSSWKNPLWTAYQILQGLEIGFSGWVFALGALILFGAGIVSYARSRPIILGLLFIPSLVGALVVIAEGHHLWPRFFFFEIGFGALVIIRGVMTVSQTIARYWSNFARKQRFIPTVKRPVDLGLILCVAMIMVSALSVPFAYGPKQDYQGAYDFVKTHEQPGDAVVTVDLASFVYQDLYQAHWTDVTSLNQLNQIRSQTKRTWLVYTFSTVLESVYPDIMTAIQNDFTVEKEFRGTVGDGMVYVCLANKPSAAIPDKRTLPTP